MLGGGFSPYSGDAEARIRELLKVYKQLLREYEITRVKAAELKQQNANLRMEIEQSMKTSLRKRKKRVFSCILIDLYAFH